MSVFSLNDIARNTHALYYIVVFDLSDFKHKFFTLYHKHSEGRTKVSDHKMFVSIFFTNLSEIFLIPRRIRKDTVESVHWCLCKL